MKLNSIWRGLFGRKRDESPTIHAAEPVDDPADVIARGSKKQWDVPAELIPKMKKVSDYKMVQNTIESGPIYVMDSKSTEQEVKSFDVATVMDSGSCEVLESSMEGPYSVPDLLAAWYGSQSFIGHQMCAILAQHWLVDKACSQSVQDAVRNGWETKADVGHEISDEQRAQIDDFDIKMNLSSNLVEAGRFCNVFGIRIVIFLVDSEDKQYYTKPFNPDGIRPGSYKGMSQVDPYWMTPLLTNDSMNNPAGQHFYEPDYWVINGTKYHRSHLFIMRGPQPADILKPTYIFGGVPLTQRIYERVYAAERTANEAPLLAMNKRTTVLKTDTEAVMANENNFVQKLLKWIRWRDNHGVKVIDTEEEMNQMDTSLADLDSVIMNQYQLVAAIARTPSTKLLGTSPKGFNATGEFETVSYHEFLESIQDDLQPMIDRHYLCLSRSLGLGFGLNVIWEPVDSMTAMQRAEINSKIVQDGVSLVNAGAISPDNLHDRLARDKDSGWNDLNMADDADTREGASPENVAELLKAQGDFDKGEASIPTQDEDPFMPASAKEPVNGALEGTLDAIIQAVRRLELAVASEHTPSADHFGGIHRTPGIQGINGIRRIGSVVGQMPTEKLPTMKIGQMVIAIENPRGSVREGISVDGEWSIKMPHHYGFIKNTMGADGDEIDCFVGPNPKSKLVFVINQKDINSGDFDEHKVMFGFNSAEEAVQAYADSYSTGDEGIMDVYEVTQEELWKKIGGTCENHPYDIPMA